MTIPYCDCANCPLSEPAIFGRGNPREDGTCDVMIVGEGPGYTELIEKKVFVGPSGRLLNKHLAGLIEHHIWITNAALCGGKDAKEKTEAAKYCRERLIREVFRREPKLIITLGNIPTDDFLGKSLGQGITKRRGVCVDISIEANDGRVWRCSLLPTFHPAAILRDPNKMTDFSQDFEKAKELLSAGPQRVVVMDPKPEEVPFKETADYAQVLQEAENSKFAVLDLETEGLHLIGNKILCAVIATEGGIYIIPQNVIYTNAFRRALMKCKANWSGHNAKFDRNMLITCLNAPIEFKFDTMLVNHLFDERQGKSGLKEVARGLWAAEDWEAPIDALRKTKGFKGYGDIPRATLNVYAANDGYWQYKLTSHLCELLKGQEKFRWILKNLIVPGIAAFSDAEVRGINLDIDALNGLLPVYTQEAEESIAKLGELAGHPFNPRSPKQTAAVMFDELAYNEINGRSTESRHVLKKLPQDAFIRELLHYRDTNTTLTRYINGLLKAAEADGRAHTSYNIGGTRTGRLSSSQPNLQNITRKRKNIKAVFVADDGQALSKVDYSQIELRMIAWFSDDDYLTSAFREGRDLHGELAAEIFGPDYTKEQRDKAKPFNFGLPFGRSVKGIMGDGDVDISLEEATRISREFFRRSPGIVRWIARTHREVRATGRIETPLGRVRRFYNPLNDDRLWGSIQRQAVNFLPQSAANEITFLAFTRAHKAGLRPLLTTHDEIICMHDEKTIEEVHMEQRKIMLSCAYELYGNKVPFEVDGKTGKTWADL